MRNSNSSDLASLIHLCLINTGNQQKIKRFGKVPDQEYLFYRVVSEKDARPEVGRRVEAGRRERRKVHLQKLLSLQLS